MPDGIGVRLAAQRDELLQGREREAACMQPVIASAGTFLTRKVEVIAPTPVLTTLPTRNTCPRESAKIAVAGASAQRA